MYSTPSKIYFLFSFLILSLPVASIAGEGTLARARVLSKRREEQTVMGRTAEPGIASATLLSLQQPPDRAASAEASGTAALGMIHFPWQGLGYKVTFLGRRPGYRALTLVDKREIDLYIKTDEQPDSLAFDLAHEFGHVVDLKYNDTQRRRRWMELRGIDPSTPWYGCSACSDFDTPAGDFAETFAYLLLGPGSYHSRMAPPPRPEQIHELAELCHIEHVASALLAPANPESGPARLGTVEPAQKINITPVKFGD